MEKFKKFIDDKLHISLSVFILAASILLLSGAIYFFPSINAYVVQLITPKPVVAPEPSMGFI